MDIFRARFTKWYCRRGYRMEYEPCDYADGVSELVYICPWWVKLLANLFFSPSMYYREISTFKNKSEDK